MEKSIAVAAVRSVIIGFLFILLGCNNSVPEAGVRNEVPQQQLPAAVMEDAPVVLTKLVNPPMLADIYMSQVGVREKTGHNDGREVEMYLRSVGLGKGYAWCSAFVKWCLDSAGIDNHITAWAPTACNPDDIVWNGKRFIQQPKESDIFCLYYTWLNRVGHTGFFHKQINSSVYESVEGNTNAQGSREGDGVYRKKRSFNATYSITRRSKAKVIVMKKVPHRLQRAA